MKILKGCVACNQYRPFQPKCFRLTVVPRVLISMFDNKMELINKIYNFIRQKSCLTSACPKLPSSKSYQWEAHERDEPARTPLAPANERVAIHQWYQDLNYDDWLLIEALLSLVNTMTTSSHEVPTSRDMGLTFFITLIFDRWIGSRDAQSPVSFQV